MNAGQAMTAACQDDRLCDLIRLALDAELQRTRRAEKMRALAIQRMSCAQRAQRVWS